ncbi:MAG: MFS transporter [Thermoplasmata archaeon]|nr:MFS transporter [Thermoplasmata archaeon]
MGTRAPPLPFYIQFLSQASLSASILFIPLVVRDWGGTGLSVGLVVAGYNLAFLVSNMASGRGADIYPRRWIVRTGLACSILAFLLQAMVVSTDSLPLFAVARIMGGLAAGMFPNALLAFVYEGTGKVGVFTSRGSLGWAVGMFAAGIISLYSMVFLFSTLLFVVAFALSLRLEPLGEKGMRIPIFPWKLIKENKDVYGALLIRHTGASMIWVTFPIFMSDLGAAKAWIGMVYAANMLTQFFLMPFLDRFDPRKLVSTGLLVSCIVFLWFTTATTWWHLIPSNILLGTGWAMLYVGCLKLVMERNAEKATSSGVVASTIGMSGLIGPIIGGPLAGILGYSGVMYIASTMAVAALGWFIFMRMGGGHDRCP